MAIVEPVIRPPSEADSFLLQVTLGCSSDSCGFCRVYKDKPFAVKDSREIREDIKRYAAQFPGTRRVFLIDGNALVLSNKKLLPVLWQLQNAFPRLSRVASYANGSDIVKKSSLDLAELRQNKLSLIYIGLESGSQEVLNYHKKQSTAEEAVIAVNKAEKEKIKSSVIVLLGLGGKKHSQKHVSKTIEVLNKMQPRYLSFLSLMVIPKTPLAEKIRQKEFIELSPKEILQESYEIIRGLRLEKTIFRADHASNYLSLGGVFPKDKGKLLGVLEAGLCGSISLKPDILRAL